MEKQILRIEKNFEIQALIGKDVTFVNPFSYLEITKPNSNLKINQFKIFADGIGVVILYNIFLRSKLKRFAFDNTSVAPLVFDFAIKNDNKVFLVGGKSGVATKASEFFIEDHPGLNLIGAESGYFDSSKSRNECLNKAQAADMVIVGMGAPLQELFLVDLRDMGWSGTGFTCGGFMDQTATNGMMYFPEWSNKYHLRWLYRLWDEPRRLGKRYLIVYAVFLFTFFARLISFYFSNLRIHSEVKR